MIDPRHIPDSDPKPKATYCNTCGLFVSEDGIRDYFIDYKFMDQYEVTEGECKNCKNEKL